MKQMNGNLILFILLLLLMGAANCLADTGTYRIIDYSVTLDPKPNGEVVMDYSQTWLVTGGYIPWVTVGLANANYQIIGWGGAAKIVSNGNDGSWVGARVDLNKNYMPNEKFTYNFTIIQRNLLNQGSNGYEIIFTPGWYDRSSIDKLSINVVSPIDLKNVTTDPLPATTVGRTLLFSKNNLGMGERYEISVKFPKNAFFKIPAQAPKTGKEFPISLVLLVIIIGIIIFASYYRSWSTRGSYYDYRGPVVSSGHIRRGSRSDENSDSGGSGAFGGRATSCACVSCACACACAGGGGGGAGCARKWLHLCNKCDDSQYSFMRDVVEEGEGEEEKEKEETGDGR